MNNYPPGVTDSTFEGQMISAEDMEKIRDYYGNVWVQKIGKPFEDISESEQQLIIDAYFGSIEEE